MDTDLPLEPDFAGLTTEEARKLKDEDVGKAYAQLIPTDDRALPASFWDPYSPREKVIGQRCCLLLWIASQYTVVPHSFQLQAAIAMITGRDVIVDVGTGYGKTFCMVIPALYFTGRILLVVSPLKRLQVLQVLLFEKYGIGCTSINEDTPNDHALWARIESGHFPVLIVQPEQLSSLYKGHRTRLSKIMDENPGFLKKISGICIDEAHFVFTAGLDLYGVPAFRPAFGRLGSVRVRLGKSRIPVQALSGTFPPHIKEAIISTLVMNKNTLLEVTLSSNRPASVYATHTIVGSRSNMDNMNFMARKGSKGPFVERVLVFHDDSKEAARAAMHTNARLAPELQGLGIARHYHGGMSKAYLVQTFDDFADPQGTCRFLHATSGASTGIDIAGIQKVIQYGVVRDVPSLLQRAGRAGRSTNDTALVLMMEEAFVRQKDLSDVTDIPIDMDPDHPLVPRLSTYSSKEERTGYAMLSILQSKQCLRSEFADYLGDKSSERCATSTGLCCDRHPGEAKQVDITKFFDSPLLYLDPATGIEYYGAEGDPNRTPAYPKTVTGEKRKMASYRPIADRRTLVSELVAWRRRVSTRRGPFFKPEFILTDSGIALLAFCSKVNDFQEL